MGSIAAVVVGDSVVDGEVLDATVAVVVTGAVVVGGDVELEVLSDEQDAASTVLTVK